MFGLLMQLFQKKGCRSQSSILESKGTVGLKQPKQFITVSIDFAQYRVQVHHNVTAVQ